MKKLNQITLIIPTYNKPENLQLHLSFWKDYPISVIILDGSEFSNQTISKNHLPPNFTYLHYKENFAQRVYDGVRMCKTKYCALLFDDEIFIPASLDRAVNELERDPSLTSVSGQVLGFKKNNKSIYFMNMYPEFGDKNNNNNNNDSNEIRMFNHLNPYTMSTLCAVHRVKNFNRSAKIANEFKNSTIPAIFELIFEISNIFQGKNKIIDEIMWLRNCSNPPLWDQRQERSIVDSWVHQSKSEFDLIYKSIDKTSLDTIEVEILSALKKGIYYYVENQYRDKLEIIQSASKTKQLQQIIRRFVVRNFDEGSIFNLKILIRKLRSKKRNRFFDWGSINEIYSENPSQDLSVLKRLL
jgi:glycosyltransferase domain-containing protein